MKTIINKDDNLLLNGKGSDPITLHSIVLDYYNILSI